MTSQWNALLKNLGEWEGSFTRLSSVGELLEDRKSVVCLEGLNNNQTIRQTIRLGKNEKVLEYSSLGKGIMFFENGAFSQGSIQLAPFSEFGAEFGLINGESRLRLVQLFDRNLKLNTFTLIREYLAQTQMVQRPVLTVDALLGEWIGEAITIYPDFQQPDIYSTHMHLRLDNEKLVQSLSFANRTITSIATIKNSLLFFEKNQVQVLLLPDGASVTSPLQAQLRKPLFLEVGWLIKPNLRQRMIRSYNDKGEWISLTLVTETKS
ncbi:MAG: DUF3598 family protein [Cyanobacteria bacterium J06633_8]